MGRQVKRALPDDPPVKRKVAGTVKSALPPQMTVKTKSTKRTVKRALPK